MRKKDWYSIKVKRNIAGNIEDEITKALQQLTDMGFDPAFVTSVGIDYDGYVIVSGFAFTETEG